MLVEQGLTLEHLEEANTSPSPIKNSNTLFNNSITVKDIEMKFYCSNFGNRLCKSLQGQLFLRIMSWTGKINELVSMTTKIWLLWINWALDDIPLIEIV